MHDRGLMKVLAGDEAAWRTRLCQIYETSALGWNTSMHRTATAKRAWTLMSESQLDLEVRTMQALSLIHILSEIELSAHLHAQQLAGDMEKSLADALEASDRRVGALAASLGMRPGAVNPWGPGTVLRVFAQSLPLDDFSATLVPATFDELRKRLPALMRDVLPRISTLLEGSGVVAVPAAAGSASHEAVAEHAQMHAPVSEPDALRHDTVANLRARPAVEPTPGATIGHVPRRDEGLPRYRDIVHEHLCLLYTSRCV